MRCNGEGTAEVSESCVLGCNGTEVRCNDLAPSNGLAAYLDMASGEADFDLGAKATFNTDTGAVEVDGQPIVVRHTTLDQTAAPAIRIFIVHSLVAADVTITGGNAIAIVSHGHIKIEGTLAASGRTDISGPGVFNDSSCQGKNGQSSRGANSGAGGGGFGSFGGRGGSATSPNAGTVVGSAGGSSTGNPELVPLRGGCDAGRNFLGFGLGGGGGGVQLVSRSTISVVGVLAANGASNIGGGSGGGILLEAPVVEVSGNVVANGAGGGPGCGMPGEAGRLDAMPAAGGVPIDINCGRGGSGASRNVGAGNGVTIIGQGEGANGASGGSGGGGVGRIRVNTVAGGLHATGVFSPNPSTGTIATR